MLNKLKNLIEDVITMFHTLKEYIKNVQLFSQYANKI